jgi:hypothetical protein
MARVATLEKDHSTIQLGMFPGMKVKLDKYDRKAGKEPPRLKTVVAVQVEDRKSGEICTRKILLETDNAAAVGDLVVAAITHDRTLQDIRSFCEGREG